MALTSKSKGRGRPSFSTPPGGAARAPPPRHVAPTRGHRPAATARKRAPAGPWRDHRRGSQWTQCACPPWSSGRGNRMTAKVWTARKVDMAIPTTGCGRSPQASRGRWAAGRCERYLHMARIIMTRAAAWPWAKRPFQRHALTSPGTWDDRACRTGMELALQRHSKATDRSLASWLTVRLERPPRLKARSPDRGGATR